MGVSKSLRIRCGTNLNSNILKWQFNLARLLSSVNNNGNFIAIYKQNG